MDVELMASSSPMPDAEASGSRAGDGLLKITVIAGGEGAL